MTVIRHPNNQGVTLQQWRKTAAGGETSLSGTDDFSAGLAYTVGAEEVFVNGVLIERGVDYTATSGTSVTLTNALVAGDLATVSSPSAFNVANAIPKATVTAKGDVIVGTAASTVTNLAVGSDGTTLVANSSVSTGVSWAGNQAAGKNKILNSNYSIWQRGTSFAAAGTPMYTADRWGFYRSSSGVGVTVSRQTSTLTGFQYVARVQRDSGNTATTTNNFYYSVESLDTYPLAGKTLTLSFWARAGANYSTASSTLNVQVQTGTGTDQNIIYGYTGAVDIANGPVTLTTTWTRFTITTNAVASTATEIGIVFANVPVGTAGANDWYEIVGVQLEASSVATSFQTATGTLQGELSACQRYYYRRVATSTGSNAFFGESAGWNANSTYFNLTLPVTMRANPSTIETSAMSTFGWQQNAAATAYNTPTSIILSPGGTSTENVTLVVSKSASFTAGSYYELGATSAGAYVGVSAEL